MKPSKEQTAAQFGRMSKAYATSPGHARGADLTRLVDLLAPEPHMRVLDVACGSGNTAAAVAPRVRLVAAGDLALPMLQRVTELAAARGLKNVRAAAMDVEHLPFPGASFDAVTCRIAPHHFADARLAVAEVARVLKPGGIFAFEDNIVPPDPALDIFLNEVERLRDPTHVRSYNEEEWKNMLQAAGLRVVRTELYRRRDGVAEWLDRAGTGPKAQDLVYERLDGAPESARRHFELEYESGHAVGITDDKLLLRAERMGKNSG